MSRQSQKRLAKVTRALSLYREARQRQLEGLNFGDASETLETDVICTRQYLDMALNAAWSGVASGEIPAGAFSVVLERLRAEGIAA